MPLQQPAEVLAEVPAEAEAQRSETALLCSMCQNFKLSESDNRYCTVGDYMITDQVAAR